MLIYFGYSFCPDVCPTTLGVMAQALDRLGADSSRIVPVFITMDPARDTPKVLADYMKAFGPQFCRPDRQRRQDQGGGEGISRLCRQTPVGERQLWHGPFFA